MSNIKSDNIVSNLIDVLMSQPGSSKNINIEEIDSDAVTKSIEEQIADKLATGVLTYSEYKACIGDDSEEETELNTEPTVEVQPVEEIKGKTIRKIRKRKRMGLPAALQGLMGEANLRWARGDTETAEKMCLEIIRQVPTASEPFYTLAQLYENLDYEKSLQYSLIAAHLSPKDPEEWLKFAKIFEERRDTKQQKMCLTRAVNADTANLQLHLKRIQLYESFKDTRLALLSKLRMIKCVNETDIILEYAPKVAQEYYKLSDITSAKIAMDVLFKKCSPMITMEHINCMLDLLLAQKDYKGILTLLMEYCGLTINEHKEESFIEEFKTEEKNIIISYTLHKDLPIDISTKLNICLIHMKQDHLFPSMLEKLFNMNVETNGDLLFDVAEAFLQECYYDETLKILDILIKTDKFCMAAVWLRHAECLQACHRFGEALESYKQVILLAPQLTDVKVTLSSLLEGQSRVDEALDALIQDTNSDDLDTTLLLKRCRLSRDNLMLKNYLSSAILLISRQSPNFDLTAEVNALNEIKITEDLRIKIKSGSSTLNFDSKEGSISSEQEWLILLDIVFIAFQSNNYDLMHRIIATAMQSKVLTKSYKSELEFMALLASLYSKDTFTCYDIVKNVIANHSHNTGVWNIYNLIIQRTEDMRHNRYLMRFLMRDSFNIALRVLHANNCLVAGTFKYALNEYIEAFQVKETPLVAFLISLSLLQMACQKFSAKKHSLVVQGLAFMTQYQQLRGEKMMYEVEYNLGRAYQQLGLFHLAVHHYKNVLEYEDSVFDTCPEIDLKKEAAFNLFLCYSCSGYKDVGLYYMRKYIRV